MEKIKVDQLVVEVTRRCNACCAHCLRGDAENCDITNEVLERLFDNIEEIRGITFSGGEPSLNVPAIRKSLEICKEKGITVGSIFVVTNGLQFSMELVDVMWNWLFYCMGTTYESTDMEEIKWYCENDMFGLSLSVDEYHPTMDIKSCLYRGLPFYSDAKERPDGIHDYLINEGRAEGMVTRHSRTLSQHELVFELYDDDDDLFVEMVYCNVYGNIFPCCDMSYDRQDRIVEDNPDATSIFTNDLINIVTNDKIDYREENVA